MQTPFQIVPVMSDLFGATYRLQENETMIPFEAGGSRTKNSDVKSFYSEKLFLWRF